MRRIAGTVIALFAAVAPGAAEAQSFAQFVQDFRARAVAAGVPGRVYDKAMAGVQPVDNIPGLVTRQPEFATPIWDYIDQRVSAGRIARGRAAVARNKALFARIGQRYGVDPYLLGAIWGMETDYGSVLDSGLIRPIVPSLATLVWHGRDRAEADANELISALKLIAGHHWTEQTLVGSWAGAVGHTQIIASGLLAFGADGDGDGIVNPHASLADALASTAHYLRQLGYRPGTDWGFEVSVPADFDYSLAARTRMRPVHFFTERGVKRVLGRQFSDPDQEVFLYLPAGKDGPKFLMTANYLVLKSYNFSDSYALSVAHLTDRLKGAGSFVASWPRGTEFPDLDQRIGIQRRLKQLGYYDGAVDGRLGPISQEAYQRFQVRHGLVADGFITRDAYRLLQQATD